MRAPWKEEKGQGDAKLNANIFRVISSLRQSNRANEGDGIASTRATSIRGRNKYSSRRYPPHSRTGYRSGCTMHPLNSKSRGRSAEERQIGRGVGRAGRNSPRAGANECRNQLRGKRGHVPKKKLHDCRIKPRLTRRTQYASQHGIFHSYMHEPTTLLVPVPSRTEVKFCSYEGQHE